MDANHRFELLATVFYMVTGIIAPGKDVPAARMEDDYEKRAVEFGKWCTINKTLNDAWLKCLEVQSERDLPF